MNTLTKDQIQRLTPEQQSDLAAIELRRLEKKARLLRQARKSRIHLFTNAIGMAAVYGVAIYYRLPTPLLFCLILLAALIYSQTLVANRRIDALLELFEMDDEHVS